MKKFVNFYVLALIIFIIVGVSGFSFSKTDNPEQEIEQLALEKTPGYATMRAIEQMTKEQQLENAILDIQVTPKEDGEIVQVDMQSSEFMSEKTLLKDSYNMLLNIAEQPQITAFTFIWHQPVKNKNKVVLTMSFDRQALDKVKAVHYEKLPEIATDFQK